MSGLARRPRPALSRTARRLIGRLQSWARAIRSELHALYLAGRDPRVPWAAKALAVAVVAYAVSPIDLIPDFIPVIGYLDDLLLVPLGIYLAVRLIPPAIMAEHRARARAAERLPASRAAAGVVVAIWLALALLAGWWVYREFGDSI
ncbi:MAG: DUF1232 domain-containing protein [Rhodospirillales bacterium]|nr:DUF1232 domain-containing protein [Rhodospirillales bacterium]